MPRKYVDCREYPNSNCSLRFSGEEQEIITAVRDHVRSAHAGTFKESDLTDENIRSMLKDEPQQEQVRHPAA